jgi:hypothetical protein
LDILQSSDTGEEVGVQWGSTSVIYVLQEILFKPVRREVLYNILIELVIPMKLVMLVKIYLNETCSKVCIMVKNINVKKHGSLRG